MVQKCGSCRKTFGRVKELGKCVFCDSSEIKPIKDTHRGKVFFTKSKED